MAKKSRWKDYTSLRFGHLVVVENIGKKDKKGSYIWKMKCDCGNDYYGVPADLPQNAACGCRHIKHGMYKSRVYRIWTGIIARCTNSNLKDYVNYGGRGIEVCDEWKEDFIIFYNWAEQSGYREDLTIERVNVNDDYKPSNCKWISLEKQQSNRTDTVYFKAISPNGEVYISKNYAKFAREHGLDRGNIGKVLIGEYSQHKGWKFEKTDKEEYDEFYNSLSREKC